MTEAIRVQGLREFSRSLKRLDADLPKALRVALNQVSTLVIGETQPKIPSQSGRARSSLRASSTRTAVRVSAGGSRARHYPWLDFGGRVGIRRSVARPFVADGRYLYRSYYDLKASGRFEEALREALIQVAEQAGLEVDSGG